MKEAINCVLGILIFLCTTSATFLCFTLAIHMWKDIFKNK